MKSNNSFRLDGKIAVVTGGAGLIGRELVKGLAHFGAVVIIADIDRTRGKMLEREFKDLRLKVVFKFLDIRNGKTVSNLVRFINNNYGRLDIWVNSAYPKMKNWGTSFKLENERTFRENIDMHLNGYFICCQKVAEYMKKQKNGSIINFGSIYGIVGPVFSIYKGTNLTVRAAYSAIKGGILSFSRYLASYYGKYNVRINCISPGGIYNKQHMTFVRRYCQRTPLGRMADSQDIVGGVIYLASDTAKYVTGHNLVIDGGWSII